MRILVTCGTGTVGSETVRQLTQQSIPVSVLTHSPNKTRALLRGAEGVVGDLTDMESLTRAFRGVDRLFLITPVSETETQEGLNAIRAAEEAGVGRIVLLSIHDVEQGAHIPHFRSKIELEAAIRKTGIPCTILMPNNFYQNDYWFKHALLGGGIYPQPLGDIGLSRVDVRDIAEAATNALLENGHENQRYPLVGPEALTGEHTAAVWSRHLGRPVRYLGNDIEAWGREARKDMPGWMVDDLKMMYSFFVKSGLRASKADLCKQGEILQQHEPRDYDSFVMETARAWHSEVEAA
jgi:uncharacterized protein YbjT (DUF2867 family)